MEERILRHLHKILRLDLMDEFSLNEQRNILFYKHKENSKNSRTYGRGILIEKNVDLKILWVEKAFLEKIEDFCYGFPHIFGDRETDSLEKIRVYLEDFISSDSDIVSNLHSTWNPLIFGAADYEVKIGDDYVAYYWDRINPELILCSE